MSHRLRLKFVKTSVISALGLGSFGAGVANADLITPASLKAGDKFRYIYLTTLTTDATSNSLSIYDAIATQDASNQGFTTYNGTPVSWQALLSTPTVDANSRIPATNNGFYRIDGAVIAIGKNDLFDGAIQNSISTVNSPVWTGSSSSGAKNSNKAVGSMSGSTRYGLSGATTSSWLDSGVDSFSDSMSLPIYAFSSELTVASVPEPSSVVFVLSAMIPALFARWRRSSRPAPII